ncbi:hypothetical protein [Thiocystis violascens]|uniref:Uncharacterized protein n=1 Tax=Thiocystis violascens (strain ATCC 17096 / DSM 198 / 6111) TaxID=765911 RepID=I3YEJ0_THIV6|nr:hypothetical protein [Thiocystis violascens]AFL75408.1 Phage related hypothetical protein (DUF1799) [Thiocystis violascens DSM 198]
MDIRGQRTWCADCTAPEVLHENLPLIRLFLDALPAWQGGQGLMGATVMEGFDRTQVLALMDLSGIAPADRPDTWDALRDLEAEYRTIRASQPPATPHR